MTILGVEMKLYIYTQYIVVYWTIVKQTTNMIQYVVFQSLYLSVLVSFLQGNPFSFLSPIVLSSLTCFIDGSAWND